MPFVKGFLRIRRRGHPDQGLPGGEGPVDPDYGIEEGEPPGIWPGLPDHELPTPPPGIWPPPTPSHPIVPLPPEGEGPAQLPVIPPGSIWPKPPGAPESTFVLIAWVPGYGWKYITVDPSTWPHPEHPIAPGGPPTATPKRS